MIVTARKWEEEPRELPQSLLVLLGRELRDGGITSVVLTDADGTEIRRLAYAAFGEEAENLGTGAEPTYSYTGSWTTFELTGCTKRSKVGLTQMILTNAIGGRM